MPADPNAQAYERRAEAGDAQFAIAYALLALADDLNFVARAIDRLGNADAATPMGAIEAFGLIVKEAAEGIALSIDGAAGSIDAIASELSTFTPPEAA